jgi:hypothetical protein
MGTGSTYCEVCTRQSLLVMTVLLALSELRVLQEELASLCHSLQLKIRQSLSGRHEVDGLICLERILLLTLPEGTTGSLRHQCGAVVTSVLGIHD